MISVPNHQQRLSGNKILTGLGIILALGACSPKTTGVLQSPGHQGGMVSGQPVKKEDNKSTSAHKVELTKEEKEAKFIAEKRSKNNSITLVLPFQLDKVNPAALSKADVTRSSIALDFYQGFQMGLDEVAKQGKSFVLDVVDSRDDELHNTRIAHSLDVRGASLIVGPVYPKEIRSFGEGLVDKSVLQINPLAASRATDYNLSNLVSLTPSITMHTRAMASQMARDAGSGDVLIIYSTADADGKQFLTGFAGEIRKVKPNAQIKTVSSLAQLNEVIAATGSNLIAVGTTDKTELRSFLSNLDKKVKEGYYTFKLYGHPLWDRIDFSGFDNFENYSPIISAEAHIKSWSIAVKDFKEKYTASFGVAPSDHAFKGYDVARYFGNLMAKYGADYANYVTKESYDGLYSSYSFEKNNTAGYLNNAVSYKVYRGATFQLN